MTATFKPHKITPPEGRQLGYICDCGKKFPNKSLADNHMQEIAIELIDAESKEAKVNDKLEAKETPVTEIKKAETIDAPSEVVQVNNRVARPTGAAAISGYLNKDEIKELIKKRIDGNPAPFISSIMTAVNGNEKLQECTPQSILGAAIEASALDLSVNPNLGQAYLVPYKDQASLQMGYKGFIQLAQRSGQYKTISATPVYEGQLVDENPMTGNTYDWKGKTSDKVVGYVAYFKLLNGFEKEWYMTVEQVQAHAKRFSQSYRKGFGPWKDHEERMSLKTPLRFLLNTYGLLSVELQRAIEVDQGVIEGEVVTYPDNTAEIEDKIKEANTKEEIEAIMADLTTAERKELAHIALERIKELS